MKEKTNRIKEAPAACELADADLDGVVGGVTFFAFQEGNASPYQSPITAPGVLHTLKEKAINAVNDTNTEVDRNAIQKEIDASFQQIDDNALTEFHGVLLHDGHRPLK